MEERRTMSKRFYHYDGQGSTQLLTDESGNVTDSYANTAYGTPVSTGVPNLTVNPFRFVGQLGYYLDADTGNYYVRARTYSPVLAKWLCEDPIGHDGGINLYAYVGGSPLVLTDPEGTITDKECNTAIDQAETQMKLYVDAMKQMKPPCNFLPSCVPNKSPACKDPNLPGMTSVKTVQGIPVRFIQICYERADSVKEAQEWVAHEIVHAFDSCSGCDISGIGKPDQPKAPPKVDCNDAACTEIRAASLSGQCAPGAVYRTKLAQQLGHPVSYAQCVLNSAQNSLLAQNQCGGEQNVIRILQVEYPACRVPEVGVGTKLVPWSPIPQPPSEPLKPAPGRL
jgi:RHS repeat-associated protein